MRIWRGLSDFVQLGTGAVSRVIRDRLRDTVSVKDFNAIGDGTTDDTTAFQNAINQLTAGGRLDIPRGTYLITDTLTISVNGVHIVGANEFSSLIKFNPGSAKECFKFINGATTITGAVEKLGFLSSNSVQKTGALHLVDVTEFTARNIYIATTWIDAGNASIGIHIEGRQTIKFRNIWNFANLPFRLSISPNTSLVSVDHCHFSDCYSIAHSSQPNWLIDDGVFATNCVWRNLAMVNGTYGVYWNDTTSATVALANTFDNLRWEQSTNATGYILYLAANNPQSGLTILGCYGGSGTNHRGYYLRKVRGGIFSSNTYAGTVEALNIDSTVTGFHFIGNLFNTAGGATLVTTGWVDGAWIGNEQVGRIGVGVANPTADLVVKNDKDIAGLNSGGTEKSMLRVSSGDKIQVDRTGLGAYFGGVAFFGSLTHALSHEVGIPNNTNYSGGNAAASGTIAIVGIDASDRILIGPAGTAIRIGLSIIGSGGGSALTFGSTGGSGPTTAAQNGWIKLYDGSGNAFWIPVWI